MDTLSKRKVLVIMFFLLIITCFGSLTSYAFDVGYKNAVTYTGAVENKITTASQVDWYKFII